MSGVNFLVDFKVLNSCYYYGFVHHFVIILNGCEWRVPASDVIPFEMSCYEQVMVNEFFGLLKSFLFETNDKGDYVNSLESLKFIDIEKYYPSNKNISVNSNAFANNSLNNKKLIINDRKTLEHIDDVFERAVKE